MEECTKSQRMRLNSDFYFSKDICVDSYQYFTFTQFEIHADYDGDFYLWTQTKHWRIKIIEKLLVQEKRTEND